MLAEEIKEKVKLRASKLKRPACLACIIVEGNPASEIYVASKQKACESCGINSKIIRLKETVSQAELESTISALNQDKDVSAILLQLPLPKHLNEQQAINLISPQKDADCLTSQNLGRLFSAQSKFAPCTASGIIELLNRYNIKIEGKNAVVVGRSLLVGKPVAALLEQHNATVTISHSKTQNLIEHTRQADILIVAIGKPNYITASHIKPNAVVIDVGINRINPATNSSTNSATNSAQNSKQTLNNKSTNSAGISSPTQNNKQTQTNNSTQMGGQSQNNKQAETSHTKPQTICGDVNFDEVKDKCSHITPVPGGVGPLTVACLLSNTLTLAEQSNN